MPNKVQAADDLAKNKPNENTRQGKGDEYICPIFCYYN